MTLPPVGEVMLMVGAWVSAVVVVPLVVPVPA